MAHQDRLARLRARMKEQDLDAFLVSSPENRRYLSGFTGSAGLLLITPEQGVLATDFRYVEQAGRQAPLFRVVRISQGLDWFPQLLGELGARRVGFEAEHLTVDFYHRLLHALKKAFPQDGPSLVATTGLVDPLRAVKEPEELALLSRAVEITDRAFEAVAPTIQVGETERQVAWRLERTMREMGAEGMAFEVIVAAGPNAALPHHRPSDRPIGAGEPIVIDMGARYEGYCADMTRTLLLGPPDETFRRVYDTVLGAQLTAIATIQAGMTAGEADTVAREVIARAGYGDNFGHSLGHGIGLAVHEYPRLGPGSQARLEEGMVFTVEPGVYITGWGGVRIEDTVVLERGGVRPLSRAHKRENPRA